MKNYKEMADDVIRRIDEYEAAHKHERTMIFRTAAFLCCVCLTALLGFGLWKSGMAGIRQPVALNDSADIGKSDSDAKKADIGESESYVTDAGTFQREIAYEVTTKNDYNKLALNFNELVKDADLILKIRVEDVNAFINNNGMIQTEITPAIQEVYKGSYNNEKLYVNGGEMLYDEFCQNEIIKKAVCGHEAPNDDGQYRGKYVRQRVDNQYIFNCGEEYIFFAKKRADSGKYYSLYAYQGTFKISSGMVENTALNNEEPLRKDIYNIFNIQSEVKNSELETFTLEEVANSGFMISEKIFTEKINKLK